MIVREDLLFNEPYIVFDSNQAMLIAHVFSDEYCSAPQDAALNNDVKDRYMNQCQDCSVDFELVRVIHEGSDPWIMMRLMGEM